MSSETGCVNPQVQPILDSGLPVIWVLGGPGSGKGTQCDKIVATYNFEHISSGDLLRLEVSKQSERAQALQAIMNEGKLVPMDIVLDLIREAMLEGLKKNKNGFLIDGYPRELIQGLTFEKSIVPVNVILYFECQEQTLIDRLLNRGKTSGRQDDNIDTIKNRLQTFLTNNDAILKEFEGKLVRINAERSVDEIFVDVKAALDKLTAKK
ncbi:adenylate kinase isoenzyme 1 [Chrysoperla carnea]|uniref:adenylate kinase isoenzyme 1 n=1 Tax=Chrysoperla carnea TaxID=189513 RepID=UPI001D083EF8|nr:adenylate kinase isoenzyme 1 [Chrysoperla carnea]